MSLLDIIKHKTINNEISFYLIFEKIKINVNDSYKEILLKICDSLRKQFKFINDNYDIKNNYKKNMYFYHVLDEIIILPNKFEFKIGEFTTKVLNIFDKFGFGKKLDDIFLTYSDKPYLEFFNNPKLIIEIEEFIITPKIKIKLNQITEIEKNVVKFGDDNHVHYVNKLYGYQEKMNIDNFLRDVCFIDFYNKHRNDLQNVMFDFLIDKLFIILNYGDELIFIKIILNEGFMIIEYSTIYDLYPSKDYLNLRLHKKGKLPNKRILYYNEI